LAYRFVFVIDFKVTGNFFLLSVQDLLDIFVLKDMLNVKKLILYIVKF